MFGELETAVKPEPGAWVVVQGRRQLYEGLLQTAAPIKLGHRGCLGSTGCLVPGERSTCGVLLWRVGMYVRDACRQCHPPLDYICLAEAAVVVALCLCGSFK